MVHLLLVVIYLAFIGLGLPDSLLGSAWPSMYGELNVPVSYAGIISMTIAAGTIVSSLQSDRLTKWLGAGKITAVSTAIMAVSMLGFSASRSFFMLWLWAIPYGLGAGSVDAALNNYVALHYPSRHMSWLHCMWGVGTLVGPNVMAFLLTGGSSWNAGYRCMAMIQALMAVILFISLPLWKKNHVSGTGEGDTGSKSAALPLHSVIKIPGAKEVMFTFFCYCAVEQTAMLWGSTYLVLHNGVSTEMAARLASLFFIGITAGRAVNGFLTCRFTDTQMIRIGQVILALGILAVLIPFSSGSAVVGLILIGVGCAPIYPSIIHSTPEHFGADKSQALIGVQMASAYVGTCLMPPLFGLIANNISVSLFPVYLAVILVLMVIMHERLVKKTAQA
ncbi:MAG: MFS transporter [Lachnospiraceae bacterium]|nr:MFS transporter [Lachnospiraceae bacterium]